MDRVEAETGTVIRLGPDDDILRMMFDLYNEKIRLWRLFCSRIDWDVVPVELNRKSNIETASKGSN